MHLPTNCSFISQYFVHHAIHLGWLFGLVVWCRPLSIGVTPFHWCNSWLWFPLCEFSSTHLPSQRTLSRFWEPNFTTIKLFSSALTFAVHNTITIVVEQTASAASRVDSCSLKQLESGLKQLDGLWRASACLSVWVLVIFLKCHIIVIGFLIHSTHAWQTMNNCLSNELRRIGTLLLCRNYWMAAVVSFCLMTRGQIQVDLVVNNPIPQSPSWSTNTGQSGLIAHVVNHLIWQYSTILCYHRMD